MTQTEWTRETALAVLEECERTASIPWTRKAWDAAHQQPSSYVLRQLFGSWTEAWRAVGGSISSHTPWTSARVLARLRAVGAQHGRWLTIKEWEQHKLVPSFKVVLKALGPWREAWRQAGYEVPAWNKSKTPRGTWNAERILQALRDHARSDGTIMGLTDWIKHGYLPNRYTIAHYWGSYDHAVAAAGLTAITDHQYQRPQVRAQWLRAWDTLSATLGRAPTVPEWNAWPDHPVGVQTMAQLVTFSRSREAHLSKYRACDLDYVFNTRHRAWIEAYRDGQTLEEISRDYQVTRETVRKGIQKGLHASRWQARMAQQALLAAAQLDPMTVPDPVMARLVQNLQDRVPVPAIAQQMGLLPERICVLLRQEIRAADKRKTLWSLRELSLREGETLFRQRPHAASDPTDDPSLKETVTLSPQFVATHSADAIEALSIAYLGLSVRAYHCLCRAQIDTVGALRRIEPDNLLRIRNFGQKCLQEVTTALAALKDPSSEPAPATIGSHPIDTRPVSSVPFSRRVSHCLASAHITTLSTLRRLSDAELLAIPNFGQGCLREVRALLQRLEAKVTDPESLVVSSYE